MNYLIIYVLPMLVGGGLTLLGAWFVMNRSDLRAQCLDEAQEHRADLLNEGVALTQTMATLRRRGHAVPDALTERFDAVMAELETLR